MSYQARQQYPCAASLPADVPQPHPRQRVWLAALTLFFLAPFCGEVLSTSTPPTQFFLNPVNLIFQPALYGSGALLIRELVRRRRLPWSNLLILGAAYGILEEGLVVNTWFSRAPNIGYLSIYGRAIGVNWLWALELTAFHAVVSIAIPIVVVEALFPQVATRPWLRTRGSCLFTALLSVASLLGALGWGFILYAKKGYPHPPGIYLLAVLMLVGTFVLGLRLRLPVPSPAQRPAPSLWRLRFLAFGASIAFFLLVWVVPVIIPLALIPSALLIALLIGLSVVLRRWSTLPYWGAPQRLALACGVLVYFMMFSLLVEAFSRPLDAIFLLILNLILLLVLVRLAQRAPLVIEIPGAIAWQGPA